MVTFTQTNGTILMFKNRQHILLRILNFKSTYCYYSKLCGHLPSATVCRSSGSSSTRSMCTRFDLLHIILGNLSDLDLCLPEWLTASSLLLHPLSVLEMDAQPQQLMLLFKLLYVDLGIHPIMLIVLVLLQLTCLSIYMIRTWNTQCMYSSSTENRFLQCRSWCGNFKLRRQTE